MFFIHVYCRSFLKSSWVPMIQPSAPEVVSVGVSGMSTVGSPQPSITVTVKFVVRLVGGHFWASSLCPFPTWPSSPKTPSPPTRAPRALTGISVPAAGALPTVPLMRMISTWPLVRWTKNPELDSRLRSLSPTRHPGTVSVVTYQAQERMSLLLSNRMRSNWQYEFVKDMGSYHTLSSTNWM